MFLIIDKPKGITSHDVVDRVRKVTGNRKVGHGGTLDPNATGVLIIGVSRSATKHLGMFTKGKDKEYEAEIFLGETRTTHDAEGEVVSKRGKISRLAALTRDDVIEILKTFEGKQMQIPPAHSAVKIKGKKAYELARKGHEVKIEPREVEIYSIELIKYAYPILSIIAKVSSGTYIRSLARDIGEKLEVGAYLKELRRTKVGDITIQQAVKLEEITKENWQDIAYDVEEIV